MNLRQIITLVIVLTKSDEILEKDPSYIFEKADMVRLKVPEIILDEEGRAIFNKYKERWGLKWNTEEDLKVAISEFSEGTGEVKK